MAAENDSRPDAVAELVRALREQAAGHTEHIAELERRLAAANQRIADQQRLLARLLEKGAGSQPPAPLPAALARLVQPPGSGIHASVATQLPTRGGRAKPASIDGAAIGVVLPAPSERVDPAPITDAAVPLAEPVPETVVRIPIPRVEESMPRLDSIADAILLARSGAKSPCCGDNSNAPQAQAHEPTAGFVRAVSEATEHGREARETTLTLDRDELARGHRAIQGRKRWFPFGRR